MRYGHLKYQFILFSLFNALANFQKYVNKILAEKLDVFVIAYLDDILIYTEDTGQRHMEAARCVFGELQKYNLFTNLKKCYFQ